MFIVQVAGCKCAATFRLTGSVVLHRYQENLYPVQKKSEKTENMQSSSVQLHKDKRPPWPTFILHKLSGGAHKR